ncbi:MAG: peptidoglycan DD-metalloendopeptidase family protein [Clostridia bacterium]|nr:peptidoglycan DD-metalloendopeptidase family protein [Clostridia bacterium]
MKLKKFIKTIALVLCFSFLNSVISVGASGASAMPQGELSVQNVSADSVSEQAKKQGEDYYVSLLFVFIHSEPSLFSSAGIVVYGQKVTVLSDSGFYTYVKTENGTKGYIFTIFLSKSLFKTESDLISVDYANVYLGDTKSNLVTDVNANGSVSWTVTPNGIIDLDEKTGDITGLKYGTATITARSGFKSDTCVVHCIYEWKKSWVGKATTSATVKTGPGDSYDSLITMKSGHKFTVYGDGGTSENGADNWAYGKYTINGNNYYGYVKINNISTKGTVSQYNNMNWRWPLKNVEYNYINSPYGTRDTLPTKHKGFDISTNWGAGQSSINGQTIVSAFTGTVDYVCKNSSLSWGYCVSIISDDEITDPVSGKQFVAIYMHMKNKPKVSRGKEVSNETELGYVGNTGNSTGPHLHFEVNNKTASIYELNGEEASYAGRSSYNDLVNPIFFYISFNPKYNKGSEAEENHNGTFWYGSE